MRQDPAVKINAIREKALRSLKAQPHSVCPTCGKPAAAPFRRHDVEGRVVEGCVDAHHHGHLVTPSSSADWYYRPTAVEIRRTELRALTSRAPSRRRAKKS